MLPTASLVLAAILSTTSLRTAAPLQAPAPTTTPAAPAATETPATYNATDLDTLRPLVGKDVEITGTPTGSGHSKSGNVAYLNFAGAHKGVALVFFLSGGAAAGADTGAKKAQSEDDIRAFVGKAISVKGKLADYKGDLQIVINSLDQIKVTE